MTTHEAVLHPPALINELKKKNTPNFVWLPDSETISCIRCCKQNRP
ncbi:MAG: hypothetical protein CM1200mP15_16240 [Dehalococcoidia bacterium]|nr:MAG: hypothetical protein CM1200mP15_16240 [Dehalococcoidia bacterium]